MAEPNYPFYVVARSINALSKHGVLCFQKFTCSGCGQRLTMDEPNKLWTEGTCDRCPAVTNIRATGCNFMIIASTPEAQDAALRYARGEEL